MTESTTITGARRTLGEQLSALRLGAVVTQQELSRRIGYSRSTIANVEVGRQATERVFWENCDKALNTGGLLAAGFDQIDELQRQISRKAAESAQRERLAQISEWQEKEKSVRTDTLDTQPLEVSPSFNPTVSVIQKAFRGIESREEDDGFGPSQDLERRVVEAYRHNDKRPPASPSVTLVGGFAGSGKSEFARFLSAVTGWAILDKDTLTRSLVEQLLLSHGGDVNDRNSDLYLTKARPHEYRCMMDAAFENVECGISTVLTAPFLKEFADPSWLQRVANRCAKHGATLTVVWIKCDVESMFDHISHRGAARDAWKLGHWDEYVNSIDPDFEPSWNHYTVDNQLNAAIALADQARDIAVRVAK